MYLGMTSLGKYSPGGRDGVGSDHVAIVDTIPTFVLWNWGTSWKTSFRMAEKIK